MAAPSGQDSTAITDPMEPVHLYSFGQQNGLLVTASDIARDFHVQLSIQRSAYA
jgi:hypothetical protein